MLLLLRPPPDGKERNNNSFVPVGFPRGDVNPSPPMTPGKELVCVYMPCHAHHTPTTQHLNPPLITNRARAAEKKHAPFPEARPEPAGVAPHRINPPKRSCSHSSAPFSPPLCVHDRIGPLLPRDILGKTRLMPRLRLPCLKTATLQAPRPRPPPHTPNLGTRQRHKRGRVALESLAIIQPQVPMPPPPCVIMT